MYHAGALGGDSTRDAARVPVPLRRVVAATPRPRHCSVDAGRGDATVFRRGARVFRGDGSRRRGYLVETKSRRRRGRDVDLPWRPGRGDAAAFDVNLASRRRGRGYSVRPPGRNHTNSKLSYPRRRSVVAAGPRPRGGSSQPEERVGVLERVLSAQIQKPQPARVERRPQPRGDAAARRRSYLQRDEARQASGRVDERGERR